MKERVDAIISKAKNDIENLLKCNVQIEFSVKITCVASDILTIVSNTLKVSIDDIKGKSRVRHIVEARHIAMYILYKDYSYCKSKIAYLFQVDHTTVIHALKNMNDLIESNDQSISTKLYLIYLKLSENGNN